MSSNECEGCEHWDEINGCWMGYNEWCGYEPFDNHYLSYDDWKNGRRLKLEYEEDD